MLVLFNKRQLYSVEQRKGTRDSVILVSVLVVPLTIDLLCNPNDSLNLSVFHIFLSAK